MGIKVIDIMTLARGVNGIFQGRVEISKRRGPVAVSWKICIKETGRNGKSMNRNNLKSRRTTKGGQCKGTRNELP